MPDLLVHSLYSIVLHVVNSQLTSYMSDYFLLKLVMSFVIAGTWITISTIIAEKLGPRFGGLIAGIPSTIVISLFFIGWTQTALIASQATTPIPIVMGITAIFIVSYVVLSKHSFYFSLITSLSIWFILTLTLVLVKFDSFLYSWIAFIVLFLPSYYVLSKRQVRDDEGQPRRALHYTRFHILFRGALSGAIIAFAVIMAKVGGPLVGGIFAVFPAVVLSMIIITYLAQGESFSRETAKVMMISGSISVVVYATTARYAFLYFGLIYGTLLSFIAGLISTNLVRLFLKIKIS